jgi:hypothetical protein
MSKHPVQTTVPSDVAEFIERLAREQMIPKSAVVRQLLVRRVKEVQNQINRQEVPA